MEVRIERLPELRVAGIRVLGPYAESGPKAWKLLTPWIARRQVSGASTMFLGLCHDDPEITPPERIRYDAMVTVPEDFEPDDYVIVRVIRSREYAVAVHKGPYATLPWSWSALFWEWLPASGRTPLGAPRMEAYLNAPDATPEDDLLTRLYLPLAPL